MTKYAPFRARIDGRLAWEAREIAGKAALCRQLGPAQLREIDRFLAGARGRPLESIGRADLAGPALEAFMQDALAELQSGRGVVIIQGCTLDRYSRADFERIFWAMSAFIGVPISQSVFGERLAHVRHEEVNPSNRSYRTTRELIHHTDTPDALGLMCVRTAKAGGLSTVVSALALHNEILATRPELLEPLYRGAPYFRFGQELAGEPPVSAYDVPVFCAVDGVVSVMYVRHMIEWGAQRLGRPVDPQVKAAIDHFDRLATDPRFALHYRFESGDIQFVNNRTLLHSRTEYVDHDDPEQKRDLLRVWLDMPYGRRPVVPEMDPYQQPASGGRGGVAHQPEKAAA